MRVTGTRKHQFFWMVVLVGFFLLPGKVKADQITFDLLSPRIGSPEQTLTFTGILTNTGTQTEFLNELRYTVPAGLTFDVSPFFSLPESLAAGESTGPADLFRVRIGYVGEGSYIGTVTISGGASVADMMPLATKDFEVRVVPEPTTLLLLGTGLAGFGSVIQRRRRHSQ